jgi:exonuclease SbcC
LDVNFPESGLIGIVGHNGAGKSSLLESIGWALYGTQAIRGKIDGLTTIGAKGKCRVSMEFDHGEGGPYLIERTLKDAKLKRGGKEIAVMTSGVKLKVEKLLNMDYRAFYTSIFTKQGGLSSFTDMTASQRQETVERLLEVSKVKDARITIGTEARALENRLHGKRVAIQSEEGIIDTIAELKEIIGQLKNRENELEKLKKLVLPVPGWPDIATLTGIITGRLQVALMYKYMCQYSNQFLNLSGHPFLLEQLLHFPTRL